MLVSFKKPYVSVISSVAWPPMGDETDDQYPPVFLGGVLGILIFSVVQVYLVPCGPRTVIPMLIDIS